MQLKSTDFFIRNWESHAEVPPRICIILSSQHYTLLHSNIVSINVINSTSLISVRISVTGSQLSAF